MIESIPIYKKILLILRAWSQKSIEAKESKPNVPQRCIVEKWSEGESDTRMPIAANVRLSKTCPSVDFWPLLAKFAT